MKSRLQLTSIAFLLLSISGLAAQAEAKETESKANRIFEMRTYHCNEGKLDALNARFRNHTNKLFKKHGIDLIGYWVPMEREESKNTLVYILAYPSRESREKSWKGFMGDSAWKAAYKESTKDGRLVKKVESKFMTPTDYSPIK